MTHSEFKEVVKQLKKTVVCNECKAKITDETIVESMSYAGEVVITVECGCKNKMVVHAAIKEEDGEKVADLNIKVQQKEVVTMNEVLDMKLYLDSLPKGENEGCKINFIKLFT